MTISLSNNVARQSYAIAQGVTQSSFTVSFAFFDDDDLNVYVDGTLKTLTTHYTVSGGSGSTGSVTMTSGNEVTGITGGSTVVITRDIDLDRTTDFPASGPFAIATLNTELDKMTAQFADRKDDEDRSIRLQDFDENQSMELPLKADRLGKVLGFNATTGAVEAGPTIADTQSLAAVTADIAALADIEDGTTATDAISGLAAIKANVTTVAGIASNVTTVAGISSNVTSVAGNATNINTVAGKESEITSVAAKASLITSDFVSDLNTLAVTDVINDINTLATSDIVSDLNTLATSDIVSDLNTLATSDIVSDINTLATSDIVTDLNLLATSDFVSDLNTMATTTNVNNLGTVAGAVSNVNTVAGISSDVTAVAGISSDVAAVENIAANVTTVAGIASNVTTVAGDSSDISTVAGISTNVSTVATNNANVTSVAGNATNINTVAGISSDVTSVAGISSDVSALASALEKTYTVTVTNPGSGNVFVLDGDNNPAITLFRGNTYIFDQSDSSNTGHPIAFRTSADAAYTTGVTSTGTPGSSGAKTTFVVASDAPSSLKYYCTVHGNSMGNTITITDSNISLVATNIANVNTVGGAITNVNNVGGSIANVNTVATNLSGVNSFAERYRVGSSDPTTSLDEGDLFYNTTDNGYKFYDGSAWQTVNVSGIGNVSEDATPQLGGVLDTNGNNIEFPDSSGAEVNRLKFGTGDDLQIFHNGTNSVISDQGTGNLLIQGSQIELKDAGNSETLAQFAQNGAASLYYDNSKKIETTSTGIDVTGTAEMDTLSIGGTAVTATAAELNYVDGVTSNIQTQIDNINTDLSNDTSPQLGGDLDANGNNITLGDSSGTDNNRIVFGTDSDLDIFHDGSASNIRDNGTGPLNLRGNAVQIKNTGSSQTMGKFTSGGAAELWYANSKKIETTSTGIDVTGTAEMDTLSIGGTAVTATPAELNILDGVTATASELNILDGVTATTAELNKMDGVTATTTEINYLDGVTSNIQTQLNNAGAPTVNSAVSHSSASSAGSSGNYNVASVTITPSSSSAKIFIVATTQVYAGGNPATFYARIRRGSTTVSQTHYSSLPNYGHYEAISACEIDEPGSTSAQTYHINVGWGGGSSSSSYPQQANASICAIEVH